MDEIFIPNKIKEIIKNTPYSIDTIGMSKSQVICFNDMVLKIEKQHEESDNEHIMMKWLEDKLPVPKVLHSMKEDGINYLLMSKIQGNMSCSIELLANPSQLVKLLADGLKMLWRVDISKCPYDNSIDNKLKQAEAIVLNNLYGMENVEPTTYGDNGFKNPEELLQWLKENNQMKNLFFLMEIFVFLILLLKITKLMDLLI